MTPYGSEVGNNVIKEEETSVNSKARKNDEELSGSEEFSPLPGRSLSWKSSKDSPHSIEKKYMHSSKRRSSFSSIASSLPKHRSGKSCRQIRRRETRSAYLILNSIRLIIIELWRFTSLTIQSSLKLCVCILTCLLLCKKMVQKLNFPSMRTYKFFAFVHMISQESL